MSQTPLAGALTIWVKMVKALAPAPDFPQVVSFRSGKNYEAFSLYAGSPRLSQLICEFCEISKEESNHCYPGGAFVTQISLRDWDCHTFFKESN